MSRPILNQITTLAQHVPDQSVVVVEGREVVGVHLDDATGIVHLDLAELVPQLEAKPSKKEKADGPRLG